jgi:hypothetical protein
MPEPKDNSQDNSQDTKGPQVKQGAVTPRRLQVGGGFSGAFLDARFDNEGVSVAPVSRATEESLRKQFPNATIKAVTEKAEKGADA